jgi:hypothetical protein
MVPLVVLSCTPYFSATSAFVCPFHTNDQKDLIFASRCALNCVGELSRSNSAMRVVVRLSLAPELVARFVLISAPQQTCRTPRAEHLETPHMHPCPARQYLFSLHAQGCSRDWGTVAGLRNDDFRNSVPTHRRRPVMLAPLAGKPSHAQSFDTCE